MSAGDPVPVEKYPFAKQSESTATVWSLPNPKEVKDRGINEKCPRDVLLENNNLIYIYKHLYKCIFVCMYIGMYSLPISS